MSFLPSAPAISYSPAEPKQFRVVDVAALRRVDCPSDAEVGQAVQKNPRDEQVHLPLAGRAAGQARAAVWTGAIRARAVAGRTRAKESAAVLRQRNRVGKLIIVENGVSPGGARTRVTPSSARWRAAYRPRAFWNLPSESVGGENPYNLTTGGLAQLPTASARASSMAMSRRPSIRGWTMRRKVGSPAFRCILLP